MCALIDNGGGVILGGAAHGVNTPEGAGNRKNRCAQALGSAREVGAIYDAATAMGRRAEPAPDVRARLHHVIAVLVKVTR